MYLCVDIVVSISGSTVQISLYRTDADIVQIPKQTGRHFVIKWNIQYLHFSITRKTVISNTLVRQYVYKYVSMYV